MKSSRMPTMARSSVDLPLPLSPTMPSTSASANWKDTPAPPQSVAAVCRRSTRRVHLEQALRLLAGCAGLAADTARRYRRRCAALPAAPRSESSARSAAARSAASRDAHYGSAPPRADSGGEGAVVVTDAHGWLSGDAGDRLPGAGAGNGPQQGVGIGVQRRLDHRLHRPALHHLARVHHGDVVGDRRKQGEVVGHVHDRHVGLRDQRLQQRRDVRLRGHVQAGRRLVEDEDRRPAGKREGQRPRAAAGRRSAGGDSAAASPWGRAAAPT